MSEVGYNNNIIIMIFYCGLIVHITDTRTQKVVSYTSAHITETVLAHDQHYGPPTKNVVHPWNRPKSSKHKHAFVSV